eukprot:GCRY01003400.1.p1 GENE.GCRY01003400.1~~GCRY01003400.1.p1  ORF type:complete len:474 (+),score=119.90 GCRY01003400.1:104-1423(+)
MLHLRTISTRLLRQGTTRFISPRVLAPLSKPFLRNFGVLSRIKYAINQNEELRKTLTDFTKTESVKKHIDRFEGVTKAVSDQVHDFSRAAEDLLSKQADNLQHSLDETEVDEYTYADPEEEEISRAATLRSGEVWKDKKTGEQYYHISKRPVIPDAGTALQVIQDQDQPLPPVLHKATELLAHFEGRPYDDDGAETQCLRYFEPSPLPKDEGEHETAIAVREATAFQQQWGRVMAALEQNTLARTAADLKEKYELSSNPVVQASRVVTHLIGKAGTKIFGESETAKALKTVKKTDPAFTVTEFLEGIEKYLAPTVLSAYNNQDIPMLRKYLRPEAYAPLEMTLDGLAAKGLIVEAKVHALREFEMYRAGFLDERPYIVVTFLAQQSYVATDEAERIVDGSPSDVKHVYHSWALMRFKQPDGQMAWRVVEMATQNISDDW